MPSSVPSADSLSLVEMQETEGQVPSLYEVFRGLCHLHIFLGASLFAAICNVPIITLLYISNVYHKSSYAF